MNIRLRPSDLPWLYSKCPRCYWRSVRNFQKPRDIGAANSSIGNGFDAAGKGFLTAGRAKELGMPYDMGMFQLIEWVRSATLEIGGVTFTINGKLDRLYVDPKTDDYVLVDFKAGVGNPDSYWSQLMAYVWALENPEPGTQPKSIIGMGIISLDLTRPECRVQENSSRVAMIGDLRWHELAIDRAKFLALLEAVASVAVLPSPPFAAEWCEFCRCVEAAKEMDSRAGAL